MQVILQNNVQKLYFLPLFVNAGKFINIVAKWPGSTHDSHILRTSAIGLFLEGTTLDDGVLLGDSARGYACSPYLMTPYHNPINIAQRRFNRAQKSTRSSIERAFGILKRRFHILHSEIRMSPEIVCTIIAACCVLHNIAIDFKEPVEYDDDQEELDLGHNYDGPNRGEAVRNHITNTYFS